MSSVPAIASTAIPSFAAHLLDELLGVLAADAQLELDSEREVS